MSFRDRDIEARSITCGGRTILDPSGNLMPKNLRCLGDGSFNGDVVIDGNLNVKGTRDLQPASAAQDRREEAYRKRVQIAYEQYSITPPDHQNNGDEQTHPTFIGNFSKGLAHNSLGEPTAESYNSLLRAIASGRPDDYAAIITGHPNAQLKNPQAAIAFDTEGADSHALYQAPAPAFSSAWRAGEAVEDMWMALCRDVSFSDYGTGANTDSAGLTTAACDDLNALSDFRGPKVGGLVTPATLFRLNHPGDLVGPFISQFLYLNCPYGATSIDQKMTTPLPGAANNFNTSLVDWLARMNGQNPTASLTMDSTKRYIRNGRDLGEWVHIDVLNQLAMHAMLVLFSIGCPVNPGNPYNNITNQCGFGTFGGPHVVTLIAEVCSRALKAQWFQKWNVHRALRPEEYWGRVDRHLSGATTYPLHPDVLNSDAADRVHTANGTWFLPNAFPEGCPLHPAYGSGHATVAGATVTILKAWFNGSFVIANPKVPNADGTALVDYVGPTLTVENELNKLAANIAQGRCIAGVHWRTDSTEAMKLGEQVAIEILRDSKPMFNENFAGFTFKKFDGTTITV
jgi:hypothetical protein